MMEAKTQCERLARHDLNDRRNATALWEWGLRLSIGDDTPINHELACDLYKAATKVEDPIKGGHPIAMLHLALHHEKGLGVEQSYAEAYKYYKMALEHPMPGEDVAKPALLALSRYHKDGLGGAIQSKDLEMKYLAMSKSNPEGAEELRHLENWWETQGRDLIMKDE